MILISDQTKKMHLKRICILKVKNFVILGIFLAFKIFFEFLGFILNLFIFEIIIKTFFIYPIDVAVCLCGGVCMRHVAHTCVYIFVCIIMG